MSDHGNQSEDCGRPKIENSTIQERFEDFRVLLDDMSKVGISNLSLENKKQLLDIESRIARLTFLEKDIDEECPQRKIKKISDWKEKSETESGKKIMETGGAIPRNIDYVTVHKNKIESVKANDFENTDDKFMRQLKYNFARPQKSIYDLEEFEPNELILKGNDEKKRQKGKNRTMREVLSSSSEEESELEDLSSKERYKKNKGNSKNKKKKKEVSSSYDEESEDSERSSFSRPSREIKRKKKYKTRTFSSMEYLRIMAERMDTRKVPKLEAFDEESGMSLRDYLEEFEEYCMDNIKGDSRYWIRELEGQFSGELLEAFKHFRQCKDTYHKLKRKILEWYENMEEFRKKDHKRKFENAKMKKEETLFLYSMRLQRLFELAYPKKNPEKSDSLREKFLKTVPD